MPLNRLKILIQKSILIYTCLIVSVGCSRFFKSKERIKAVAPANQKIQYGPTNQKSTSFEEVSKKYGLGDVKGVRFYAVDLNRDEYTDLVVLPSFYSRPEFYYFDPSSKKFVQYDYSPFTNTVKGSFLAFYDFDKDDVLDLVIGVLNQKTELTKYSLRLFKGSLINRRIWFTELPGLLKSAPMPSASVSIIDINLDGELDLYLANWFKYDSKSRPRPEADRLYISKKFKFEDASKKLLNELDMNDTNENFIKSVPSFGVSTCDIDQDGFPEILVSATNRYANKLWQNEHQFIGNKRVFRDIGKSSGYATDLEGYHLKRGGGRTYTSVCADYNEDGVMDIYVGELTHSYDNDSIDRSSILTGMSKNRPIKFLRTEYLGDSDTFNWSRADKRANWIDLNLDSKLDLLIDNSGFPPHSRLVYFAQEENNDFYNSADQLGIDILNPEGTIILDINDDGKPDILSGQSNLRDSNIPRNLFLFENKIESTSKTIRIYPRGINANSHALGAMLIVSSELNGKIRQRRKWVEYTFGGIPSQNEEGIFFNFLENENPLKLDIRWPIYRSKSGVGRSFKESTVNLKGLNFDKYLKLTICEDGKLFLKRKSSCR